MSDAPLFLHSSKILHCAHHKAGSFWIACVLQEICTQYGKHMSIFEDGDNRLSSYLSSDVLYDNNSLAVLDYDDYIGSHIIRDLRDVIISGYFYHKWTLETWALKYQSHLKMTYQEKINSLSIENGIMFELQNIGFGTMRNMASWNYNNPKFLEFRYEDLILNPDPTFTKLFTHWGINPAHMEDCLAISRRHHMTAKTGRKLGQVDVHSHMRSGEPGQWKKYFTAEHKKAFKVQFGDILVRLGYEKDNDW